MLQELLENFSITHILIMAILLVLSAKEVWNFIDWFKGKVSHHDEEVQAEKDEKEQIEKRVTKLETGQTEVLTAISNLTDNVDTLANNVDLLISSDRDAIKAFITSQHHHLCYEQKWIDDYTLDCIEKRYDHYVEEHGNSFIEQLMNEIRALPKMPIDQGE